MSYGAPRRGVQDETNEIKIAGSNDTSSKNATNAVQNTDAKQDIKQDRETNIEVQKEVEQEAQMAKEAEGEPEIDEVVKTEPAKEMKRRVDKDIKAESFIVPTSWQIDGVIIGDKDKKLLISTGDTVYVNIHPGKIRAGTKCNVYRKEEHLKDPKTKEYLGYEVRRIGRLEFTNKIGTKVSSAKVIVTYEPIQLEDVVRIE